MNVNTILNAIISMIILGYALYIVFRGRKETRAMNILYAVVGLWATVVHGVVLYDYLIYDFLDWQFVTMFLIKPLIFVLLCTVLAAIIKNGWRYDD